MSQFRKGLSIEELAEQRLADEEAGLDDATMVARWGRGAPQYAAGGTESGEHKYRPSARHLRSAMWTDTQGRKYTHNEPGRTRHWWVEIPTSLTRSHRLEVMQGTRAPDAVIDFPREGELLTLRHTYDHEREVQVRVETLVKPKQSSAEVVFANEIDSTWRERDRAHLERHADAREQRNAERARREGVASRPLY